MLFRSDLVTRARTVAERLGTEVPPFSAEGDDAEAGYASFFERFLGRLEETTASFDKRVEEECRDLLSFATRRIFINLAILDPTFDVIPTTANKMLAKVYLINVKSSIHVAREIAHSVNTWMSLPNCRDKQRFLHHF